MGLKGSGTTETGLYVSFALLKVESDEIVAAAKKNGVPVEYVVFPDEGHGFVKKKNEVKGYSGILSFLDTHLKKSTDAPKAAVVK